MEEQPSVSTYNSNPFKVTMKQLSILLRTNPISTLTLGLLMFAAIIFVVFMVGMITGIMGNAVGAFVGGLLAFVAVILIVLRFTAAVYYLHIASRKDRSLTARDALAEAYKTNYGKFLGSAIVSQLIILLGIICLIIPGLYLAGRLMLAPYAAQNEGLGIGASLKRSWQLTSGHWFETFGAFVASSIVLPSGLLSLVGGQSGVAGRYFELVELKDSGAAKPKTHWLNYFIVLAGLLFVIGYFGLIRNAVNNTNKKTNCTYSSSPLTCQLENEFKNDRLNDGGGSPFDDTYLNDGSFDGDASPVN